MTAAEWLALEVGDVVLDHRCGGAERTVLAVKRVSGKQGQPPGSTRTGITVASLRGGRTTVLLSTEDVDGGKRFTLARKRATP